MEKVIFRKEHDPYMNCEKFLAVFPDDETNVGYIGYLPFYFSGDTIIFEPYGEMCMYYYYNRTKIVHRETEDCKKCLNAIESRYGIQFRVMEKMSH